MLHCAFQAAPKSCTLCSTTASARGLHSSTRHTPRSWSCVATSPRRRLCMTQACCGAHGPGSLRHHKTRHLTQDAGALRQWSGCTPSSQLFKRAWCVPARLSTACTERMHPECQRLQAMRVQCRKEEQSLGVSTDAATEHAEARVRHDAEVLRAAPRVTHHC